MNFTKDFPNLFQFFGGYFPDADFEQLTDEDIVSEYVLEHLSNNNYQKIQGLLVDINELMDNIDNYWEEVGDEVNRYFKNSDEALKWLIIIRQELSKNG
ncbi:hypothetical protein OF897_12375 [Chryseobacterium formosus]|uniref:CdiI immunity protein domain-containing protein n=1 Tax=Chryseobacterium formosus TaxID=1537363 RepID=A0ABT3XU37_9FLAO|nr:hypothetical protein [Chryseobacterium formosus]MCX8524709.1 hypothetical protein [Chryseobacterium formosus]